MVKTDLTGVLYNKIFQKHMKFFMQRGIRVLEVFNSPYVIKNNKDDLIVVDY
jgi:hypothetical protein